MRLAHSCAVVAFLSSCAQASSVQLSGTVVEQGTGTPVRGARVQFAAARSNSVPESVTDEVGRFTLKVADPARGDVVAAKDGYVALGVGSVGTHDDDGLRLELRRSPDESIAVGEFFGVGIGLDFGGDLPRVSEVRTPGPLRVGDGVLRVDGAATTSLQPAEVASMFRGREGAACVVDVQRGEDVVTVIVNRTRQTGPPWRL